MIEHKIVIGDGHMNLHWKTCMNKLGTIVFSKILGNIVTLAELTLALLVY